MTERTQTSSTPWFERDFDFSFGADAFDPILERLAGAPERFGVQMTRYSGDQLEYKAGRSWSPKEHLGHLTVLEPVWRKRFQEIRQGVAVLSPADLRNAATDEEQFNTWTLHDLLGRFRDTRRDTIALLRQIGPLGDAMASVHPRLGCPMRLVDLMYFVAEHDDHHLAAIKKIGDNHQPSVRIETYRQEYASAFERINREWIEERFAVEEMDAYQLRHPERVYVNGGGEVFFAVEDGQVIGTVAVRRCDSSTFELSKMAVTPMARGRGVGTLLCRHAIDWIRVRGADRVILYSNRRQSAAIRIYRALGFLEIPVEPGVFERADIKMELLLDDRPSPERVATLLESYRQVPDRVAACLAEIPQEVWDWQPPHDRWTIRQNILHLADSEAHSYIRCRMMVAQPGAQILGYDQDKWAALLRYETQDLDSALALYRLLRTMSFSLLRELPFSVWEHTVTHSEYGTMSLWQWLRYYENHTHILQMQCVYALRLFHHSKVGC